MNVKLVAVTKPIIEGLVTAEDLIVYTARVSNPSNQMNTDTGAKLIKYCIKNKHWSIFDQAEMTVEIKTSRAIAAQILRHWSFDFQEFSQRYAEVVADFEPIELRLQGKTNRQVGDEVLDDPALDKEIQIVLERTKLLYDKLIEKGVAKECARFVLPLSTQTTLYMKGSCRNWIHYLELRCSEHTQKEHRLLAQEIKKIFMEQFPIVSEALEY